MIWPEHRLTRSQDLEPAYFDAGQFYWWSRDARSKLRSESPIATALFKLPPQFVQDIDTEPDWDEAERKYRHMAEPS
jgi:CMP-N-acetylneuraminic acid synthetase